MKKSIVAVLFLLLPFVVQAVEPSDESIDRLLEVTQSRRTIDAMLQQMESMLKPMFEQAADTKSLSAEKRAEAEQSMASFAEKMKPILAEALAWDKLKAQSAKVYKETFSQEDIDGLIAFYESPTGKVFIEKMPLVMQKSMAGMQQRMAPLMEKIKQAAKESAEEFKAK